MPPFATAAAGHWQAPASLSHPEPDDERDRSALGSDPVVRHLWPCLETARGRPSESCSRCLDHLETAVQAYLRHTRSVIPLSPPAMRGGLAPWQSRRAQEMMRSRLDEAVPLAELARALSLSPSHFARAFKQTTGQPPHRWLMERRIDKAKQLLIGTTLSLGEIALASGFADQSHLTRMFSRVTHSSPGAWRRHKRSNPPATDAALAEDSRNRSSGI
jgi:AraC family transcriptional regulator